MGNTAIRFNTRCSAIVLEILLESSDLNPNFFLSWQMTCGWFNSSTSKHKIKDKKSTATNYGRIRFEIRVTANAKSTRCSPFVQAYFPHRFMVCFQKDQKSEDNNRVKRIV